MTTISPELALVDPELAAAARAGLYEPGQFFPASGAAPASLIRAPLAPAVPSTIKATVAKEVRPIAQTGPARRAPRRVLAVGACGALAIAMVFLASGWHRADQQKVEIVAVRQVVDRARAIQDAHRAGTYTWPAVPGARAYEVVISRGQIPVYRTTTTKATVTLPASLRFRPGRYTWSASPIGQGQTTPARPVVESSFTVAG